MTRPEAAPPTAVELADAGARSPQDRTSGPDPPTCAHCGGPVRSARPGARYCGASCRTSASRARRQAALLTELERIERSLGEFERLERSLADLTGAVRQLRKALEEGPRAGRLPAAAGALPGSDEHPTMARLRLDADERPLRMAGPDRCDP